MQMMIENKPDTGDVLTSKDGERIPLHVDKKRSRVFCNVAVDSDRTGWYLIPVEFGLKCIVQTEDPAFMPAWTKAAKGETHFISSVRVLRRSLSGTSLIVRVLE